MARGDRFKRRLPKFIGRISDMDDTFFAEDKEFERIEMLLFDFENSLFVDAIRYTSNPDYYLRLYEKDYGLGHTGSIDERIANIRVKMLGKKTTTEEVVLDICSLYGSPAKFIERYREYGFTLVFHLVGDLDLPKIRLALREVVPAHLDFDLNIGIFNFLKLKTQFGINNYLQYLCGEHLCSEIPWNDKVGYRSDVNIGIKTGQYNGKNYYSWSGDFKRAGEINDFETVEELYVQNVDVDYDIVYVFDD